MVAEALILAGEIEVDKSYLFGTRMNYWEKGAGGKVRVFVLLNSGGWVYTMMIKDTKSQTLLGIIRDQIQPDSIVFNDSFQS